MKIHLQRNGASTDTACRLGGEKRTWNLVEVTCEHCKKSKQYQDALLFNDIGSPGREIDYGRSYEVAS